MTAHSETVPSLVDRIKQTLVGLKMPRAIEILDVLGRLVEKSLVFTDPTATEARFRLLETVREYAQEHLMNSGLEGSARSAWHLGGQSMTTGCPVTARA